MDFDLPCVLFLVNFSSVYSMLRVLREDICVSKSAADATVVLAPLLLLIVAISVWLIIIFSLIWSLKWLPSFF